MRIDIQITNVYISLDFKHSELQSIKNDTGYHFKRLNINMLLGIPE